MKEILIDVGVFEDRVALTEEELLVELYVEKNQEHRTLGNIYKGRVINVLPGMQAAFVDIGLEKNAFLYVKDTYPYFSKDKAIEEVIKVGQELLVQIIKEPFRNKGARVSMNLAIPGRYSVLMPFTNHVGVSRRVESDSERQRLKEITEKLRPQHMGIIIRTVAEGKLEEDIKEDIRYLLKLYHGIDKMRNSGYAPKLLYKDVELIHRVIRDLLDDTIDLIWINHKDKYESILKFMEILLPDQEHKLRLVENEKNLFQRYGIEKQIEAALERVVWLENGGYIVIDETEALTVVDVNTGKYIGEYNLRDTVYKTNLEATKIIAQQLRLRNLGGIIIIDFIDMEDEDERTRVIELMQREFIKDRIKTQILGFTQLGLLEITRKKNRNRISSNLQKTCRSCLGTGKLLSEHGVLTNLEKDIWKLKEGTNVTEIEIYLPKIWYQDLLEEPALVEQLEKVMDLKVHLKLAYDLDVGSYRIKTIKFSAPSIDKRQ